jgi:hypothetical protein
MSAAQDQRPDAGVIAAGARRIGLGAEKRIADITHGDVMNERSISAFSFSRRL